MKLLVAVLKCFLVAVIVGSAVGDEEGGATLKRTCPPEVEQQVSIHFKLVTIGKSCYDGLINKTTKWQRKNATKEDIQTYFNSMCLNEISLRECLEEKASHLELCENQTVPKVFNIFREVILNTMESGCAEGGKRFVSFMQGATSIQIWSLTDNQLAKCFKNWFIVVTALLQSEVDVSSRLYILHKEIRKSEECVNKIQLDQSMREALDFFSNEIITKMKCIHPREDTLVLCTSIDASLLSTPTVCELKTHGSQLDLHGILENEAGKCFDNIMDDDRHVDTADYQALRLHLKDHCSTRKNSTTSCLEEGLVYSDTCHNATQRSEFGILIESGKNGFESACIEDGKRLTDIMYEVYRLKRTGHGHAVWDCVGVAKSTRNVTDEHRSSSKNMRFYHEMEAFKGCLVDKLRGDQTSVDAATSLIDELLKKVECAGVEDGSTVTCESLVHHNHNDHHHKDHH